MGWWSSHEILWFFIHKENMEPEINARKKGGMCGSTNQPDIDGVRTFRRGVMTINFFLIKMFNEPEIEFSRLCLQ